LLFKNVSKKDKSSINEFQSKPSKGIQSYEKKLTGRSVGTDKAHNFSKLQVTGEAVYNDDYPTLFNELHAAFVFSTEAHATILDIDASNALKLDGVEGFYTYKDVIGHNHFGIFKDEEFLASKKVVCVGQMIGVILANTPEKAREASKLVNVKYDVLEPIITIKEAIKNNSYLCDDNMIVDGDIDSVIKKKQYDHHFSGSLSMNGQEHFYLECHASIAIPGENDEITLISSTQNLNETQEVCAEILGIDKNKIVAKNKRYQSSFNS
jgi:xanthine dehydrogenase/oxidase